MVAVPVRHPGRWVAAAIILLLAAMFVHGLVTNPAWQWNVVGQFLFDRQILSGLLVTIELTVLAMVIGVVLGVILAVMRLSPNPVLSGISWVYTWFFRGTPVLVQIVIWYNLSSLFPHLSIGIPFGPAFATASTNSLISKFTAAVLGLGLNEAAYMAEIVRAGILSVDEGQTEAASALG
ncbi:MAG TPA: ABC transporter permease subunit, partial [Pseudonocardiaceae bacterium]